MPVSDTYDSSVAVSKGLRQRVRRIGKRWVFPGLVVIAAAPIILIAIVLLRSDPSGTSTTRVQPQTSEVISTEVPKVFVQDDRLIRDLSLALTELAIGTEDAEVDAILGHPALLTAVLGSEGASEDSIVIFVNENVHEDTFATEQPSVWLRVDGSERLEPTASRVTRSDIHHRTVRFEWDVEGLSPMPQLIEEDHRLVLLVDPVSTGNTLIWDLPFAFSSTIKAAIAEMESTISPVTVNEGGAEIDGSTVTDGTAASPGQALRRNLYGVSYGGVDGIEISATFGTEDYFKTSFPAGAVDIYMPDGQAAFVVSESTRIENLPGDPPELTLNLDGTRYEADMLDYKVSSEHSRITVFRFPTTTSDLAAADEMSLELPDGKTMNWVVSTVHQGGK